MKQDDQVWRVAQMGGKKYSGSWSVDPVGFIHDLEGNSSLAQLVQRTILHTAWIKNLQVGVRGLGMGLLWLFSDGVLRSRSTP